MLGYPSGDASRRAAWRTFNRHAYASGDWFTNHRFVQLAHAVGAPADARRIRLMLRELDTRKDPADKDPPKPKRPGKAGL